MSKLSYYIRSNPSWWLHLNDSISLAAWMDVGLNDGYLQIGKANAQEEEDEIYILRNASPLTQQQVLWVLSELSCYAVQIDPATGCQPSCFERIWESDSLLDEGLAQQLCNEITARFLDDEITRNTYIRQIKSLNEDIESPIILDFVHPHDFPAISSRTIQRYNIPGTEECELRTVILNRYVTAIPTEFYLPNHGPPQRVGYITNIPPTKPFLPLLSLIEHSIGKFIPLFEHTLTALHRANRILLEPRIPSSSCTFSYEKGPDPPDEPGQGIGEDEEDEEDETLWVSWAADHARWVQSRKLIPPDLPSEKFKHKLPNGILPENRVSLKDRKIQVFIKLTRLELTPEQPVFAGGEWSSEGSQEDHIVACGSVVLEQHNVTEGRIRFRMAVTRPNLGVDDPDSAAFFYWGKRRGSTLNQEIGSVVMKLRRLIVYPNIYQHRISSFKLVDPNFSGHRTILSISLVDPEISVLSTADIPPQQASWAFGALLESLDKRLPVEIVQKIIGHAVEQIYFLEDQQRWPLRRLMDLNQQLDRDMLKRYFEQPL
ncbi:hypothetical protein FRC19_005683 [Serendipita sp. 401]|nr:hypothetical protein FRC19_005683 [Serendipita sp. 401]